MSLMPGFSIPAYGIKRTPLRAMWPLSPKCPPNKGLDLEVPRPSAQRGLSSARGGPRKISREKLLAFRHPATHTCGRTGASRFRQARLRGDTSGKPAVHLPSQGSRGPGRGGLDGGCPPGRRHVLSGTGMLRGHDGRTGELPGYAAGIIQRWDATEMPSRLELLLGVAGCRFVPEIRIGCKPDHAFGR